MVVRIAKDAGIPRHMSPHSLRHAAITHALDADVPLRDAQILACHADPRTTERYDRVRGTSTVTASTSSPPTSPGNDRLCERDRLRSPLHGSRVTPLAFDPARQGDPLLRSA